MTTLHRKPRSTLEQPGGDAKYFHTAVNINKTNDVDSNSEKSPRVSRGSHYLHRSNSSSSTSSPGSSKGRRSSKYFRRGLYSSSGSSSYSGGGPSPSSKKMSTLQLRVFFAVCVLLYFCALFFAQEIVSFGKFVSSEQTRQKIFSQWKPMHSAASQYLRAAMTEPEVASGEKRDADFVKADGASALPESDGGGDNAVSEEHDVPPPATHQVDASAAPASHEPSLNPPQEAPATAQTQEQEQQEHEKAGEMHKQGERAPPLIIAAPADHQDADADNGAAATTNENWSQAPLDAENRHREPNYRSSEPQQEDEGERAHHPVATDLYRAADEPALPEKGDERENAVVRTAEAKSTDTVAAAAAIPSFAYTDETAHSPPPAPPSKPIDVDDVSAAPAPAGGVEEAADAVEESGKQVTASAAPAAAETQANAEAHEAQDGLHHYHLDEAR